MNADLLRRLRIYFTGFGLGLIVVFFLFFRNDDRDLDIWMPEQRILEDIRNDSVLLHSPRMQCFTDCLELDAAQTKRLWTDSKTKSLNPGGDPYRYLISLVDADRHIEAEVEWDKQKRTLLAMRDLKHPTDCACND